MEGAVSVLTVTSTPHERPSSRVLKMILAELHERAGVRSHVWFLREGHDGDDGRDFPEGADDTWVVDRLRTWRPAAVLDAMGMRPVAGLLRGRRLRRRLRTVAPDAVLLDDGLGERILGPAQRAATRIVRVNADEALTAAMEPAAAGPVDLWLVDRGAPHPEGAPVLEVSPVLDDFEVARSAGTDEAQRELRASLGLPMDVPLVVGWGSGSWIDGPELFVRALWALEDRHGIAAHGAWVWRGLSPDDEVKLRSEAARCGVGDRLHLVEDRDGARLCGDIAFLPFRCRGDRSVLDAVAAGMVVVAFRAVAVVEDGVTLVDDLDVDAAAAAMAAPPAGTRAVRIEEARRRFDVAGLVDALLAHIEARPRR